MAKFLFLLGVIPILLGIAGRKWMGDRRLRKHLGVRCQLDGETFARKLCEQANLPAPVLTGRRKKADPQEVVLTEELSHQSDRVSLAKIGIQVGHALLAKRQPELITWRDSALRFAWAFPAFVFLVLIFAALTGSFLRWALPIGAGALALGTISGWLAVWIDWQAASLTAALLERRAIVAREDDRIAISQAMRALGAMNLVPGLLGALFPSEKSRKKD